MVGMVEDDGRVDGMSVYATFQMQMLGGGTPCTSGQGYHLPRFHLVAHFHQILGVMTIESFQSVRVFDDNAIAISEIDRRARHHTVERSQYLVVGLCVW